MAASKSLPMSYTVLGLEQWVSVLDSLSDPITVHQESGEIVWANQSFCELYSKPLSELTGFTCEQALRTEASEIIEHSAIKPGELDAEVLLGGKVWSVTVVPLSEKGGKAAFVRVMRDVTAERRARGHLLDAERFASLGQMLFGIAHNVGTPLNIISGYAEFLLMHMNPDERGHKELSAIMDQTRRIATMLNEALDLARPGKRQTSAIDIKALLSESLDFGARYFRRYGVRTRLTCATSPPLIYGEAPRLRQAFFSLLLNAGQKVAAGGCVELVVTEAPEMQYGVLVKVIGTEGAGQGHDFARSLGSIVGNASPDTAEVGLSLARDILVEAGAVLSFDECGEQGIAILVRLPVNASQ